MFAIWVDVCFEYFGETHLLGHRTSVKSSLWISCFRGASVRLTCAPLLQVRPKELPTIEDELAQIFPGRPAKEKDKSRVSQPPCGMPLQHCGAGPGGLFHWRLSHSNSKFQFVVIPWLLNWSLQDIVSDMTIVLSWCVQNLLQLNCQEWSHSGTKFPLNLNYDKKKNPL